MIIFYSYIMSLEGEEEFIPDYEDIEVPPVAEKPPVSPVRFPPANTLPNSPIPVPVPSQNSKSLHVPGIGPTPNLQVMLTVPKVNKKKRNTKHCPLFNCGISTTHLRRHVVRAHLPWFMQPDTACWTCQVQEECACFLTAKHTAEVVSHPSGAGFSDFNAHRWGFLFNGLLWQLCRRFGLTSIQALLDFVSNSQCFPIVTGEAFFTEELMRMFRYEQDHEASPVGDITSFSISPPTRIVALGHWRILLDLVGRLSYSHQQDLLASSQSLTQAGEVYLPSPQTYMEPTIFFIDSHFHLDSLLWRTQCTDLASLEASTELASSFQLTQAVTNYVFTSSWECLPAQPSMDPRLSWTVGLHPRFVGHVDSFKDTSKFFASLLPTPGCVGLGEIGVDEVGFDQPAIQRQLSFLETVLPLAGQFDKVLVLYCRGPNASTHVRGILRSLQLLHLRIHLVGFSGSFSEAKEWLSVCPNASFGFNSKFLGNPVSEDAAGRLSLSRILLESDSPYLSPDPRWPFNTPWSLYAVAKRISILKNLPLADLAYLTSCNTGALYKI